VTPNRPVRARVWLTNAAEAWASTVTSPVRAGLGAAAAALGVGLLVTTMVVSHNSSAGVLDRILVTNRYVTIEELENADNVIHKGASENLAVFVAAAAELIEGPDRLPVQTSQAAYPLDLPVIGADPALFEIIEAPAETGTTFDQVHNSNAMAVAVLGHLTADSLGYDKTATAPRWILVDGERMLVIGVLAGEGYTAGMANSVIVPTGYLERIQPEKLERRVIARIDSDPTAQALERLRWHVNPVQGDQLKLQTTEATDTALLAGITQDLNSFELALRYIGFAVSAGGVCAMTVLSVRSRREEIGLRLALGSGRSGVSLQFTLEALLISGIGTVCGIGAGLYAGVALSPTPATGVAIPDRLVLWLLLYGVGLGVVTGLLAALRAAWVKPVQALIATE